MISNSQIYGTIGSGGSTSDKTQLWQPHPDWENILENVPAKGASVLVRDDIPLMINVELESVTSQYYTVYVDGVQYARNIGHVATTVYMTAGSGKPCALGYSTKRIDVVPEAGDIYSFNVKHSNTDGYFYNPALWIVSRIQTLTSAITINGGGGDSSKLYCESIEHLEAFTRTTDIGLSYIVWGTSNTFRYVFPPHIAIGGTGTSNAIRFSNSAIREIVNFDKIDSLAADSLSSLFASCYMLQRVSLPYMPYVTSLNAAFMNCYLIEEITINAPSLVDFRNNYQMYALKSLIFVASNFKATTIATPIDITWSCISAAGLNALFASLEDLTGYTNRNIDIRYCSHASECDPSIATAKNWTVLR